MHEQTKCKTKPKRITVDCDVGQTGVIIEVYNDDETDSYLCKGFEFMDEIKHKSFDVTDVQWCDFHIDKAVVAKISFRSTVSNKIKDVMTSFCANIIDAMKCSISMEMILTTISYFDFVTKTREWNFKKPVEIKKF